MIRIRRPDGRTGCRVEQGRASKDAVRRLRPADVLIVFSSVGNPKIRAFAELLIDCEEDRTLRAVLERCPGTRVNDVPRHHNRGPKGMLFELPGRVWRRQLQSLLERHGPSGLNSTNRPGPAPNGAPSLLSGGRTRNPFEVLIAGDEREAT